MANKKQNVPDEDRGWVESDDDGEVPDEDSDQGEEIVWELGISAPG